MTEQKKQLQAGEETYLAVMALYAALKDLNVFRVKRAEIRQGGVPAEPLDFVCDVEAKASRFLPIGAIPIWNGVLNDPPSYPRFPLRYRTLLGKIFEKYKLGPSGDYKTLFFRIKNQEMRQALTTKEE